MEGPKQSKRVSWAPGLNLCQVRLFLSEDAPSQSGLGSQDQLQAKAAWLLHSSSAASDDSVPPGFEAPHMFQVKRNIPLIKWQCPPSLWLRPEWRLVAGEESEEVELQNQRQLGVLEAVYPRVFSIPSDPAISPELHHTHVDDSQILLIPIIAIEDEDSSEQYIEATSIMASHLKPPDVLKNLPSTVGTEHLLPGIVPPPNLPHAQRSLPTIAGLGFGTKVEPDIVAAASAAFTAIMRSNEEGSLIDSDLLIKILSDPGMVDKLVLQYGNPKQAPLPTQPPPQIACSVSNSAYPLSFLAPAPSNKPLSSSPPTPTPTPINLTAALPHPTPVKDINYYKSLILKHGGDQKESNEPVPLPYENSHDYPYKTLGTAYKEGAGHGIRQKESRKPKIAKLCAYFNTSRGCRQGTSCSYLHDASMAQLMEKQRRAKRLKTDG